MNSSKPTGWIPDLQDPRDFTLNNQLIQQLLLQSQSDRRVTQVTQELISWLNELISYLPTDNPSNSSIQEGKWQKLVKFVPTLLDRLNPKPNKPLNAQQTEPSAQQSLGTTLETLQKLTPGNDVTLLTMVPARLVPAKVLSPQPPAAPPGPPPSPYTTLIQLQPTQIKQADSSSSPDADQIYLLLRGTLKQLETLLNNTPQRSFPAEFTELKEHCHRIENQAQHGYSACTAHAGIALMEYFASRYSQGQGNGPDDTRFSSRFLYRVTRLIDGTEQQDSGASLRSTLKAMMIFGLPPEKYWQWHPPSPKNRSCDQTLNPDNLLSDPPAFCYAYAQSYQTLRYFRLDRPGMNKTALLAQIKAALLGGFPAIFGFRILSDTLYADSKATGDIALPNEIPDSENGHPIRGHAALAIGYDDNHTVPNHSPGAIYFKNSWGKDWGDKGFGWLPYDYILKATEQNQLCSDWWTLLDAKWMETNSLGISAAEKDKIISFGETSNPKIKK
ncbi:C1 family peptidase [Alkalinema sp. FACHB-956]|uniref:C1 family peptidase n=1 Tax=Alkalinema sp. FACHB-956 TaxID=2692768 RepID=UPI0016874AE1|nr:C1 family peptidase [Alkalinema sp. FACHB-956]MBD2325422.1 C1 family peptidase [Alkalinema sp. FACHB-956]